MILSIDFDRTIHDIDHPIKKMGPPIEGAREALQGFHSEGHKIIIFSCRRDSKVIADWIEYFQIPYDDITNIKPHCDFYIDDNAIRFINWKDTISIINKN